MSTCTLCGKETSAASYPVFAANTSRSGWQTGTARGTTTTYTDIVPLSFTVCPECLSARRTAKTKRRFQQGLPLIAVGALAIIIGIIFQTPTRGGICFYPELRQLAERNGRDSALTRADYYRITAHPE